MTVIETRELVKTYGTGEAQVFALRGVSIKIERGELVAIMGPSGSGKSTLLTLLGGVETPTSGQVLLEGVDIAGLNDDERTKLRRRRLGFIFQSFNLLPNLSALENVTLPLELDGMPTREAISRAREVLSQVEMDHRRDHRPSQLSGGEQQRVAIARALAIRPALLLADEPTGNLDTRQAARTIEFLESLVGTHGQTIVLVTHDRAVAEVAKRLICIRDGRVESDGPIENGIPELHLVRSHGT
ncbi:MAG: ABC transporter ATP-binding protein [Aureliella sp.]